MSPGRLVIRAGGKPALLEGERAAAPDPLPAAYRSRWRRAAIARAVQPWSRR